MIEETEVFLRDLFAQCAGAGDTFVTLTAIHPGGTRPTPSHHVPLGDWTGLQHVVNRLVQANRRGWGAYVGIATRQRNLGRWLRGGKGDLAALPALFVDLDQPEDALWRLTFVEPPPSCVLSSGRGYHAYWFLDKPTTDFAIADLTLRGLAEHLQGDSVLSVAQSMRLPGTINTKPGRDGAVCHLIGYRPEWRYRLDDFRPFLLPASTSVHRLWQQSGGTSHELPDAELEALTDAVLSLLDGHQVGNGFIRARCPLPHVHDRPGMHFSYNPRSGWGHCFGKHGSLSPHELGELLGLSASHHPVSHVA